MKHNNLDCEKDFTQNKETLYYQKSYNVLTGMS